ncbi:MAG: SAM-dependent methyltransferase [Candidatus Omnitrophota bacterium]|nr:SAM-dependent methyltransferase [Candidatus Omnitrophota bacterium]MDZ4243428.1 SAM-dependent methyltransferase [Candidatus Omnitrophota bacterium]
MNPRLYLIPSFISDSESPASLPGHVAKVAAGLRVFVVEEERSARRFLKKLDPQFPLQECVFFVLDEHAAAADAGKIMDGLQGRDAGLISEAGCPCVADPGSDLVRLAHQSGREVVPLAGASSFLLALMASGLNGQNFAFNGYLPREQAERLKKIRALEQRSAAEQQTQIFMETPYRNKHVFDDVLAACAPGTLLCIAADLTGPAQYVKTMPVREWKTASPPIEKSPAVFLIQKPSRP